MTCAKPNKFYCNIETRIQQGYDKKMYPRLLLNRLKVMRNSTSIYICWTFSLKKNFKKLPTYM